MAEQATATRGGAVPIVQYFAIEGLYGYRTVSLDASHAATILIAKNGSGKTTLLGALDAFLRGQFGRLANLQFDRIVCRLQGVSSTLFVTSTDIESLMNATEIHEFAVTARRYSIEPAQLLDFIAGDFDPTRRAAEYEDDEVFKKILARHGYLYADAKKACERILELVSRPVPALGEVRAALSVALHETEIVYLPTYRRIELSLGEELDEGRVRKRPSIQSRLGLPRRALFKTDIQFGLGDISERLRELNHQLLARSNQGYREISAKIINDLIDGTFESGIPAHRNWPDKESLALFFSRLRQHGGRYGPGPFFERVEVPDIDKVYNEGATSDTSNQFLNYFLSKLNTVISATRDIEGLVEEFINHCNIYLSARELTTELAGHLGERNVNRDDKKLQIERMNLQVHVMSVASGRKVPMDSLSSGEKQMISLFARLYLYPGKKIVLIDEPELSLSIDWQRRILVDVVNTPSCSQIVAITHSPFVFDNELEPFAKALSLRIDPLPAVDVTLNDLFSEDVGDE